MVGWARLELATNGLKGHCSTTELPTRRRKWLRVLRFPLARKTAHSPPLPPPPQKIWRFFGGPLFFQITFAWLRVLRFPLARKTAHSPPLPPPPQKIWRFFGGPLFFQITFAWLRILRFRLAPKTAYVPPLPPPPQKIWRFFGQPLFFQITFTWLRVLRFPLTRKTNSISRLINKKNKFSPKKKVNRTNKPTYQLANKPIWWSYRDSNPGPPDCKSGALAS